MVTVALLPRLLGRGIGVGTNSSLACLRLLTHIVSPRASLYMNPRCLSLLGKVRTPALASPLLTNKYCSYARLSTKPTHCANSNKTDTKSSSSTASAASSSELFGEAANMGLFAKFKHMYKQYWYVLIPVHVITSIGWFGGFYYLSKSGVDVPALLQYMHLSETIIEKVQGSDMGHYAIAYLCYKVATPVRYALTLGGTTISIKYLVQWGHIKPMPSKRQLMKLYENTKATRAGTKATKDENHK
ncbi:CG14613 [Drosophila busckii]|uniref:CG14613 n=1 Tax=Drosophila busckii TaxID=30019 RepID=A0A0M4ETF8_DROBS|nr:uncharacterized protein C18orf19 homolog A [Drosophila busckii]ALC49790.1 CG14613 [Drosophila busckii]